MRDFGQDFLQNLEGNFDFGLSFGQYMEQWLYGADGYYASAKKGDEKVGAKGDFYTAVSVSRFFGGAIAKHIISLLESGDLDLPLVVVEFGAHSGRLLGDIIEFLDILSEGVLEQTRFYTIEPLESLAQMQSQNPHIKVLGDLGGLQEYIKSSASDFAKKDFVSVFMLSNELFDAFACEVVRENDFGFVIDFGDFSDCKKGQKHIVWRSDDEIKREIKRLESSIKSKTKSAANAQANTQANVHCAPKNPQAKSQISHLQKMLLSKQKMQNGEIALGLEDFIRGVCEFASVQNRIKSWRFLSFDYGVEQKQNRITLRGYKSHRVLSFAEICADLDGLFGVCDLTYEVDFERVIALFGKCGAKLYKKSRLNAALVDFGIDKLLEDFFAFCQSEENQKPSNVQNLNAQNTQNLNAQNLQNLQNPQNPKMQLYQKEALKLRELLSPNGMGERFICVEFGDKFG